MAHHPRTCKTSKKLILPRQKHYTPSSIEGLDEGDRSGKEAEA
jgi:hypothetical protein